MIRRLLYFGYYLRKLDSAKLRQFLDYSSKSTGRPGSALLADAVTATFRYNISLLDYFYFRFYELDKKQRSKWAGTGFMYEYHLVTNPRKHRMVLEDKLLFLNRYKKFVLRDFISLGEIKPDPEKLAAFLQKPAGKVVVKHSKGQVGKEVKVLNTAELTPEGLIRFMQKNDLDLLEDYVVQHPDLMALSPSGLNTVRIFTHFDGSKIHWLGARLRITINSTVDNLGAGNAAAPVDMSTGVVDGPAVFSDIDKPDIEQHPVTGRIIRGFKIPFWDRVIQMTEEAVLHAPENRSIGWDIAITEKGPELIEGNHNWCKLLWQLPVKKGLKHLITDLS